MKIHALTRTYATLATAILTLAIATSFLLPGTKPQKASLVDRITPIANRPPTQVTKTEIAEKSKSTKALHNRNLGGRTLQTSDPNPPENEKRKTPAPAKAARQPQAQQQIAADRHSTPVATAPLTLTLNIIGQRKEPDGSYNEIIVREGSVLCWRDNFQLHLETNRAAYVYVLLSDSQGRASQLFPDPKLDHSGFMTGGSWLVIPSRDLWFWLDEHPGRETLYVMASEKPMSDIQSLLAQIESVDDEGKRHVSQELKRKIVQRGLAVVDKGPAATFALSDGKTIQRVTEVVTGTGSVVRAVSFQHR